ncbi:MAG: hypothetical protein U0325_27760 [Polyangiales bacterium]
MTYALPFASSASTCDTISARCSETRGSAVGGSQHSVAMSSR